MNQRGKLVGEFVLIVVGVLVALMVESALESRADSELRDEYIERIRVDVASDRDAARNRIEYFSAVQRFSNETLSWLDADAPVDKDILLAAFYAAEIWPFVPNDSTYQDLQSTGNIRLLDDLDLRTSLSLYYNKASRARPGWNPSDDYREIIRGVIPSTTQKLIRQNCPATDDLDEAPTGFPPCVLTGIDFAKMTELFLPLRSDTAFRRTLTYRESELGVMLYLLTQQVALADRLLQQIAP